MIKFIATVSALSLLRGALVVVERRRRDHMS